MEPKNKEMKLIIPSNNSTMARTKGFRPPTVPSRPMYVMLSAETFVPLELLFCFFIWNEKQKGKDLFSIALVFLLSSAVFSLCSLQASGEVEYEYVYVQYRYRYSRYCIPLSFCIKLTVLYVHVSGTVIQ